MITDGVNEQISGDNDEDKADLRMQTIMNNLQVTIKKHAS